MPEPSLFACMWLCIKLLAPSVIRCFHVWNKTPGNYWVLFTSWFIHCFVTNAAWQFKYFMKYCINWPQISTFSLMTEYCILFNILCLCACIYVVYVYIYIKPQALKIFLIFFQKILSFTSLQIFSYIFKTLIYEDVFWFLFLSLIVQICIKVLWTI